MKGAGSPPLLRVPPFPGAPRIPLALPTPPSNRQVRDEEVDRLIEQVAEARVASTYWAARPALPDQPYSLVRIADGSAQAAAVASAKAFPVVWTRSGDADLSGDCDPWHLLSRAEEAIVDADDEVALIAALAGVPLRCVGEGRFANLQSGGQGALREAFFQSAIRGWRYVDPFTGRDVTASEAIALCSFWRELIRSNADIIAALGFAFWKRPTVAPLLWNGATAVPFVSTLRNAPVDGSIAMWRSRTSKRAIAAAERSGARLIEVEDGFLRSSGLGADCVPPLSILADRSGIYFDPSRPSDLEAILQNGKFSSDEIARARQLQDQIIAAGLTKYAAGDGTGTSRRKDGLQILVPGQVEDDRSVICGGGQVKTNLELLRRVRQAAPDANIIYKPHPDVEAGHRRGRIPDTEVLALADQIVRSGSISSIIANVDEIHVNTSLAGFEGLLRGKKVVTYGVPFYAGWGLTDDRGPVPARRSARRTLDELVAAALLVYPRYLDPVTRLPCPAEVLVTRLANGAFDASSGIVVTFRRLQGRLNRAMSKLWTR